MVIGRRSLLLAGVAVPAAAASARAQCVTDTPSVDACRGGVRITSPPGATLDLSFYGPTLDPSLTFTRASTATYFDSSGVMQTAATNAPRFDYDPVTHVALGLLIEEQRTNAVRNSTNVGAVVGTPGTYPNAWSVINPAGLSTNVVAVGTDANGLGYIDLQLTGTSPGATWRLGCDSSTGIPASQNQVWTFSGYVSLVAGSLAGLSGFLAGPSTYTAAGAVITFREAAVATPTGAATVTQRFAVTATASDATTGNVRPTYSCTVAATTVNATLRFAGMQMELASFPTSYIPTTAAAATRSADICWMATGAWFNANAGSVVGDYRVSVNPAAGLQGGIVRLDDTSNTNRAQTYLPAGVNPVAAFGAVGGVAQVNTAGGNITGVPQKIAIAYGAPLWTSAFDGVVVAGTGSTVPLPATRMIIGGANATLGTFALNGYIRRVRFWPRVLSNSELQSVTR